MANEAVVVGLLEDDRDQADLYRAWLEQAGFLVRAYAEVKDGELWLRGFVALPDGSRIARAERRGPLDAPEALGLALADDLRADGADDILASL